MLRQELPIAQAATVSYNDFVECGSEEALGGPSEM